MNTKTTPNEHAKRAAEAHTTLCTFAMIVAIIENNNISGTSGQRTADKIVELCHKEQQRQLSIYDMELSYV